MTLVDTFSSEPEFYHVAANTKKKNINCELFWCSKQIIIMQEKLWKMLSFLLRLSHDLRFLCVSMTIAKKRSSKKNIIKQKRQSTYTLMNLGVSFILIQIKAL